MSGEAGGRAATAVRTAARSGDGGTAAPGGRGQPQLWKAVFFVLAAAAIVAGAGWALLGSSLLVVRSVRVVGTDHLVTRSDVLSAAQVPEGLPMLRIDTATIARRVEGIRRVAGATVSRNWPSTVVITVRPRVAVFAVGTPGRYDLVDAAGVTVRQVAHRPARLPVLAFGPGPGPAHLAGDPAVRAAAAVLRELPATIAGQVRSVSAPGPADISVRLAGGVVVVWGDTGRAAQKGRELAALMRTHARLYDVSAPGTAVTRG